MNAIVISRNGRTLPEQNEPAILCWTALARRNILTVQYPEPVAVIRLPSGHFGGGGATCRSKPTVPGASSPALSSIVGIW
jgi:hypothetical protein